MPNIAIHLGRLRKTVCFAPHTICGQVMACVNTSQGVARAADTVEQVISPGRPVL
jgi:hypothetical protein